MNLHDNKDIFEAAIQLASATKEEGGLGIKQIYRLTCKVPCLSYPKIL